MIKRINILARAESYSGYGEHLRQVILGLQRHDIYASVRALRKQNQPWSKLSPEIQSRLVTGIQPEEHELIIAPPTVCPTPGKQTVYWTMNECTSLKPQGVDFLNKSRCVIVPCEWNASCFSASGVKPQIRIVHLGIDKKIFHYRQPIQNGTVTFGCGGFLGNGIHRKGMRNIARIFQATFLNRSDVRLEIKCSPVCDTRSIPTDDRIRIIREFWSQEKLASWYATLTAFINIATGGWELMAHEAMAIGRPLIAPVYGGMAEYHDASYGFPVEYRIAKAGDAWTHGSWAETCIQSIAKALRMVADDPQKALSMGRKASEVACAITWDNAVDNLVGILHEVGAFPAQTRPRLRSKSECLIQLGRYGDIVNVLPIANHLTARNGSKVDFVVSKDYHDILDGVTYCNKVIWPNNFEDLPAAMNWAEVNYESCVVPQIHRRPGPTYLSELGAFNKEQWKLAGMLDKWGELPLIFDRRNEERESTLWSKLTTGKEKPVVLVSLSGYSSKIQDPSSILTRLQTGLNADFSVIDISDIKAERIYDLLGLMDRAVCLITVDSAPLHLAAASAIPVIAFISDTPTWWFGTSPICNAIYKMRYGQVMSRIDDIVSITKSVPIGGRFIHVYSHYETFNEATIQRRLLAERTWNDAYRKDRWCIDRVTSAMLPRMHEEDMRTLPYIRDLFDHACAKASLPDDVIVYTNNDVCFNPTISRRLRHMMNQSDAVYSHRRDFVYLTKEKTNAGIRSGVLYEGCDLFAFTPKWWMTHRSTLPDLLIGSEAWDWCLRILMDQTASGPCKATDLVYHERHWNTWEAHRLTIPSQRHNRSLSSRFLKGRGIKTPLPTHS